MATRSCRTCEADGETASRSKYSTVSKAQWGVVWQRFSLKQMHRHVLNGRLPSSAVNRKSAVNIKAKDHQALKSPISQTHVCWHVPCDRKSCFSFRTQLWLSRLCLCSRLALGRTTLMSQSGWTSTLRPLLPPSTSTTRTTCSIRANRYTDEPALSETVAEVLSSNVCGNESDICWLLKAVSNWSQPSSWNSETNDYIQHVII